MSKELKKHLPVGEAISLLLYPHVEVIIHDLKTKCILAIFNNFSNRKIGDESLLGEIELLPSKETIPPYFKINWDGRKIKSVSALLKNEKEETIGMLCINLDVSQWEKMQYFITDLLESKVEQSNCLFTDDWREKINTYVSIYLKENKLCMKALNRSQKQDLLKNLWTDGAFKTKNAAAYTADILNISRSTVYNYLKKAVNIHPKSKGKNASSN